MIPKSHPRYESLMTREKIVEGVEKGITSIQGLIAQGRGEAFDYLLGEKTSKSALQAEKVSAAVLLLAKKPVISVNGNAAVLVPEELIRLSDIVNAPLEVNLFHRTQERVNKIIDHLRSLGAKRMYTKSDGLIPGLEHERAKVDIDGIFSADVVLVPLEDGDRCKALVDMGKKVIAIDLNPLSRTAQCAHVTIVDNITRAVPNVSRAAEELKNSNDNELQRLVNEFDNKKNLNGSIEEIIGHLTFIC
ncbi:4-phosphopantoate--beta-alanine ligase [Candidatus Methanoperedens nitratireducens]|uniref:4-phosphopantoate--beta-alanine ligase n=1 Tax=Candidatus Methanoperedens nitratireducens TaxID=1392998 RepID=A0A284VU32_9EURY|nr:4-phosphopantoate--beta-alanine ligase [Candidatus Methanoperedens nitroreducens]SNQ62805.1 Pantothenate synthetase [Candidatus Methanoperedens nitroreducens]